MDQDTSTDLAISLITSLIVTIVSLLSSILCFVAGGLGAGLAASGGPTNAMSTIDGFFRFAQFSLGVFVCSLPFTLYLIKKNHQPTPQNRRNLKTSRLEQPIATDDKKTSADKAR